MSCTLRELNKKPFEFLCRKNMFVFSFHYKVGMDQDGIRMYMLNASNHHSFSFCKLFHKNEEDDVEKV